MLLGRGSERVLLDGLLADVRRARSQVLVIRGEPGVGKSALLQWAAQRAAPARCVRASGVESELELPYAALHQLLRPLLGELDRLPRVQARALRGALGLGPGRGEDRFLVAVAVLTLLGEAAADDGLVCLVDDAQWVDTASLDALVFVARRLDAESVALIFAERDGGSEATVVPGLPELMLRGLDTEDATALLTEHAPDVAPPVRRVLLEQAGGSPLALIELPAVLTQAQLAGREPLPEPLPVGQRIEQLFAQLITQLPAATRVLLTIAAADDTGRIAVIERAAADFSSRTGAGAGNDSGVDLGVLAGAETLRLVRIAEGRLEFCHPLLRSALYQHAGFAIRRATHEALAASFDEDADLDRRAWHLAAAAVGPDDAVAAALEESAQRALIRSGPAASAAALHRAATLTAAPSERGRRLVAAARTSWTAGRAGAATALLDEAEPLVADHQHARAAVSGLRGLLELSRGLADSAYPRLVAAAADAAGAPDGALWLALAGEAAWLAGDSGRMIDLGRLARGLPVSGPQDDLVVDLLMGVGSAVTGSWGEAAQRLRPAVAAGGRGEDPMTLLRAGHAALLLGDEAAACRVYERAADIVRRSGAIALMATTLDRLAFALVQAGRLTDADIACREGLRLAHDLGQQDAAAASVLALIAAWRGDADTCRAHARHALVQADTRGLGAVAAGASWALGLLDLGLGRWDDALNHLAPLAVGRGHPIIALWATPDLVEAAARAGQPAAAEAALRRFGDWARHIGAPGPIGAAHRAATQLAGDLAAYAYMIEQHDGVTRPLDRARAHLAYGEALRRHRRRADARNALRTALDIFDRAGAAPWADRARTELRATGESRGQPGPAARDRLTPQELQITRLAAAGASNPEIAAQLFLSRKTVEYHLHKVFTKLDITTRNQLGRLQLDQQSPGDAARG